QNAEVYSALSSENRALAKRLNHYCSQHRGRKLSHVGVLESGSPPGVKD
ncbi:8296_t:CDS:1, partial [Funneliformis caledonium]